MPLRRFRRKLLKKGRRLKRWPEHQKGIEKRYAKFTGRFYYERHKLQMSEAELNYQQQYNAAGVELSEMVSAVQYLESQASLPEA